MQQTEIITFIIIANIILLVFIAGILVFISQYRKRKLEHENEKAVINEIHSKELLNTQLEIQTQTMQHIGREIHDNVGQKLTLASLYTQQMAYENKAPQITGKIENISNIINESLAELRQLSKSLTNDTLNERSITELLQAECDILNALNKCTVIFSSDEKNILLPYQTKSILYRVVQEFLQNSIKHANCKNIFIDLNTQHGCLYLNLRDDGKGFDSARSEGKGIGLNNMKKRVELISGNYQLKTAPGSGTQLNIAIKL